MMRVRGIATPVTLVVLMVAFVSLLAATSYMALGALKGSATERGVYQAFLVAESALDAFPLLAKSAGCGGAAPASYSLPTGGSAASATYVYTSGVTEVNGQKRLPASGGTLEVQAVAEWGGAKARVAKRFQVGCGIAGAVPAALTSRPRVEVRGNAQVIGQDFTSATGLLEVTAVSLTGTTSLVLQSVLTQQGTFTLPVQDASLIPVGGYVQISTGGTPKTYRVEGKSGNTLTLKPLFTPSLTDVILPSAKVQLVQYGVKSYTSPNTLYLSDARGLLVGQAVRVGSAQATVASVDPATGQVTVNWSGTPPTSIPEGTPLVAQVVGAASNLSIDTSGQGQVQYGSLPNSPLVPSDPNELFQRVFGMTKADFLSLYPPTSASNFSGTLSNWELKVVQGPLNLTGSSRLCGQGILVVIGNLTVNGSCNSGFQGLIYVAGDYDQQGNAVLTGSVVVEGVANLQACNGNECWTQIAGTGQGGGKIVYDPLVMHRLRMATQGAVAIRALTGSWRRL